MSLVCKNEIMHLYMQIDTLCKILKSPTKINRQIYYASLEFNKRRVNINGKLWVMKKHKYSTKNGFVKLKIIINI